MNPVVPPLIPTDTKLVVYGALQPDYVPLPAAVDSDGLIMTEWEPSAEELEVLLQGGRVRIWIHTYGHPLQPLQVNVAEPECGLRGT